MGEVAELHPDDAVSREVAEGELDRFLRTMDLERDLKHQEASKEHTIDKHKGRLLDALQDGRLRIDNDGQPVFRPEHDENLELIFPEPTGATLMAFDKVKDNRTIEGTYLVLAEWTGTNAQRFSKMRIRDLKVPRALMDLFIFG